MIVPPASDPIWKGLVTGQIKYNCEFMATKVLLTRIMASVLYDPSRVEQGIDELRSLFEKNISVPKVQVDLWNLFGSKYRIPSAVYTIDQVIKSLSEGKSLLLAGSEEALSRIPKGSWIGGTSSLISGLQLQMHETNQVFAVEIPDFNSGVRIKIYENPNELREIYNDAPDNGFSVVILPAFGSMHSSFALNAPYYQNFATRPLVGWISGVPLVDMERMSPKVYSGLTAKSYTDAAIVMSVKLPPNKIAEVGVVNVFAQGAGDEITVDRDAFEHTTVLVNGRATNFSDYIKKNWPDMNLPLVANYHGMMVNSSFQKIDAQTGAVCFYTPLFRGISYRIAKPIADYRKAFLEMLPTIDRQSEVCSFDCVLNYLLLRDLTGERNDILLAPTTFGEIAYQLLNQTLVYMAIRNISPT